MNNVSFMKKSTFAFTKWVKVGCYYYQQRKVVLMQK